VIVYRDNDPVTWMRLYPWSRAFGIDPAKLARGVPKTWDSSEHVAELGAKSASRFALLNHDTGPTISDLSGSLTAPALSKVDMSHIAAAFRTNTPPGEATKYDTAGTCGDGKSNTGESCDDGNTRSGDGCSSVCKLETAAPVCVDCDLSNEAAR
jgi:cysteine-rich repeat protein